MNILFEIADKNLIFIGLAFLGLLIFAIIIFYVVNKDNKVRPITDDERFDHDDMEVFNKKTKQLTQEQEEAKAELERVYNQMSADLDTKGPEPEVIEEFEREQEENAIISYQELIAQAEAKKLPIIDDEAPVIKEIYKTIEIEEPETKKAPEYKNETGKFRNSEIISPIFGIQKEPNDIVTEYSKPKESVTPKHVYEEMQVAYENETNNEFLSTLKEFRKNL